MKTQDFKFPILLENKRKVILKGIAYECQGTIVIAMETTCSLTKPNFKGVCVGINEEWSKNTIAILGSEMECPIANYEQS